MITSLKFRAVITRPKPASIFLSRNRATRQWLFLFLIFFWCSISKAQDIFLGLTSNGGPQGRGTAFSIKSNGTAFSIVKGFADWGKNPNGDLLQGDDGNFYGMTYTGGTYTYGTIFKVTPAGVITILRQLNAATEGANPYGELIKGGDGNFYGMTSYGGTNSYGSSMTTRCIW